MITTRRVLKTLIATSLTVAASFAVAAPITGVGVTTTFASPGSSGSLISQITDGSGLSSYTPTAVHATATPINSWVAEGPTIGTITFNLGASYLLDGLAIWNFNAVTTFGVRGLTIEGSTDGVTFSTIAGAPTSFAQGSGFASETSQLFAFSRTASFIRFDVTSSYGSPGIGLSEVMFTGARASSTAVPEPESIALLGIGLLAAATGTARRRKSRAA